MGRVIIDPVSSRLLSSSCITMAPTEPSLKLEYMNPCIKKMQYAVRGPLVIRATEIEKVGNISYRVSI